MVLCGIEKHWISQELGTCHKNDTKLFWIQNEDPGSHLIFWSKILYYLQCQISANYQTFGTSGNALFAPDWTATNEQIQNSISPLAFWLPGLFKLVSFHLALIKFPVLLHFQDQLSSEICSLIYEPFKEQNSWHEVKDHIHMVGFLYKVKEHCVSIFNATTSNRKLWNGDGISFMGIL